MLVDTVHSLPMYRNHKHYVEASMIKETPQISYQELSVQLNISQGEAMVLLDEIRGNRMNAPTVSAPTDPSKPKDRSLFDFK